jgi:putative ATP-binding cassette transporter
MQSALIALLNRHAPQPARRLLLLAAVAGLCGGGLAVLALHTVQQQGKTTLTTALLFALLLAALAACIGAIAPRAAETGSLLAGELRRRLITPLLTERSGDADVLLAFERLPAPMLRGLAGAVTAVVAGVTLAAAAVYLLATRRTLGAVVIAALLLGVGLQAWRQRKAAAGSLMPAALARLDQARALGQFRPPSADDAQEELLAAFAAADRAGLAQAGGSLRARLIELSLAALLVGVGLYMAYAGKLGQDSLAAVLAQLLVAVPAMVALSAQTSDIWAGEQAARAWSRLEARLPPAAPVRPDFRSLRLEGVRYGPRERPLGPIDLDLDAGSLVVVQGDFGSGKSALVRLLGGETPALEGRVLLNGAPLGPEQAAEALRGKAVSLSDAPFPVRLPLEEGRREEAAAMLIALQLDPMRFMTDEGLVLAGASSGETARLALAAAMLDARPLLLLDDPAVDRDPRLRAALTQDWAPRLRARGKTIVIVTEDPGLAATADRTVRLEAGGTCAPTGGGGKRR